MIRDEITGEPEAVYCSICGEYIPHGQAVDILGRYVCSDCEKQIMALARFVVSQVPMTIYDYGIEVKGPGAGPGPKKSTTKKGYLLCKVV